jgi:hypothetical protein
MYICLFFKSKLCRVLYFSSHNRKVGKVICVFAKKYLNQRQIISLFKKLGFKTLNPFDCYPKSAPTITIFGKCDVFEIALKILSCPRSTSLSLTYLVDRYRIAFIWVESLVHRYLLYSNYYRLEPKYLDFTKETFTESFVFRRKLSSLDIQQQLQSIHYHFYNRTRYAVFDLLKTYIY